MAATIGGWPLLFRRSASVATHSSAASKSPVEADKALPVLLKTCIGRICACGAIPPFTETLAVLVDALITPIAAALAIAVPCAQPALIPSCLELQTGLPELDASAQLRATLLLGSVFSKGSIISFFPLEQKLAPPLLAVEKQAPGSTFALPSAGCRSSTPVSRRAMTTPFPSTVLGLPEPIVVVLTCLDEVLLKEKDIALFRLLNAVEEGAVTA